MSFEGADWIELTWPKAQKVARVVIYTDAIADCEVQVAESDETNWRTVAATTSATTNPIELTFEPTQATRLRIPVSRLREGVKSTRISEIEVYAQ